MGIVSKTRVTKYRDRRFIHCPPRGTGENLSPLGEDFSKLEVWNIIVDRAIHTLYDLKLHLVRITKYRKPVLTSEVAGRVRELVREICKSNDVEILKGHISRDHIHIFVSAPPQISVSDLVKSIEGKTSRKLLMEFKTLSRQLGGRHLWAHRYFGASSGNVTDEVIMEFIEQPGREPPDADFKIYGDDL